MSPKKSPFSLAALLLTSLASCNWLTPVVFIGEHKKQISPEFDKLANKRVAILVWVDPSTLFDYPHARFELATYVGEKLHSEMGQRKLGTDVVNSRDVEDFLQKTPDSQFDPLAVGRKFKADYVVYVEVTKFQMRDPEQPQFLRGTIHASVSVHDVAADPDQIARHELTEVLCSYPDGQPLLIDATNPPLVREAVYRKFAEEVARKFYEYSVDL